MSVKIYIYNTEKSKYSKKNNPDVDKHALLRDALRLYSSSYAQVNEFDISLAEGEHGKPYFISEPLRKIKFSISHSGKYWAVAFSQNEVGLDIEDLTFRKHDRKRYERIAKRFFSPDEVSFLEKSDLENKFFRIWTRKEAFLKYTGEGISRILSDFSTIESPEEQSYSVQNEGAAIETIIETDEIVCSCCGDLQEMQAGLNYEFVIYEE